MSQQSAGRHAAVLQHGYQSQDTNIHDSAPIAAPNALSGERKLIEPTQLNAVDLTLQAHPKVTLVASPKLAEDLRSAIIHSASRTFIPRKYCYFARNRKASDVIHSVQILVNFAQILIVDSAKNALIQRWVGVRAAPP